VSHELVISRLFFRCHVLSLILRGFELISFP